MLFHDVLNSAELRQRVLSAEIDAALMDADMITGALHLLAAANKTLVAESHKLITKTLYSELVGSMALALVACSEQNLVNSRAHCVRYLIDFHHSNCVLTLHLCFWLSPLRICKTDLLTLAHT